MRTTILVLVGWVAASAAACDGDVKMIEVEPQSIDFTQTSQSTQIRAEAQNAQGGPIPGVPLSFRSEDDGVAIVDSNGWVKPVKDGNTAIIVSAPGGKVSTEVFVKVCLPKKLVCEPPDLLKTKVALAAPVKCRVLNCRDEVIPGQIKYQQADETMLLKEEDNIFIGLKVGDTEVTATAYHLKHTVKVHVDEQEFVDGERPGSGGGGKKKGGQKTDDPYSSGGSFDHILKNMKFD